MAFITKISKLQNIYNFLNFDSDINLAELEIKENGEEKIIKIKNCLIYAPNGNGKTSLSRFLSEISSDEPNFINLLSKEVEHRDLDKLDFSLNINDIKINKSIYSSYNNLLKNIYVFNSDYIDKTIRGNNFSKEIEGEIETVMPIGEISNNIDKLKKENKGYIDDRNKELKIVKDNFLIKSTNLEKNYNKQNQNIWSEFKLTNIITEEEFEIKDIKNDGDNFKDCEEKFEKLKLFDEKDKISYSVINVSENYITVVQESIKLLGEKKEFDMFSNDDVEKKITYITKNWLSDRNSLQKGVEESKKIGKCLLCGRRLDEDVKELFENYKNYFNQEKSKFQDNIDGKVKNLEELEKELGKINNNFQAKIESYIKLFEIKNKYTELNVENILTSLTDLKTQLGIKKDKPEKEDFSIIKIDENIKNLNASIEKNKNIVEKINKKVEDNSNIKTRLRTYIGKKYLFEFYLSNKSYFNKIKEYNGKIRENNKKIENEKKLLPKKDVLSNLIKIMNIFLNKYLGLDKYVVEKENRLMKLKLLDNIDISNETNRISEGEKNMIALSYYLASSIEKYKSFESFNQVIFVIDDPISSVSYGNFFGICNLLKNFDERIIKELNWNNESIDRQKIILTHNTQFLNTLVNNTFSKDNSLYFSLNPQGLRIIENRKLMSEFKTSVYRIYKNEGNVGNDLRRFFETIKHFYGIQGNFNSDCLKKIFSNFEEQQHKEFYYASNHYSHINSNIEPFEGGGIEENMENILEQFDKLITESAFKGLWEEVKGMG